MTRQITRVSDTEYECRAAGIDGGYVVYQAYVGFDHPEIFLHEIVTAKTTRLTRNDYPDRRPRLGDGGVAWVGGTGLVYDGSDQKVFLCDIASRETTRVTDNQAIASGPRVSKVKA